MLSLVGPINILHWLNTTANDNNTGIQLHWLQFPLRVVGCYEHNKKAHWSTYSLIHTPFLHIFFLSSVQISLSPLPQLHFLSYIGLFSFLQILPHSCNMDMTFSPSDSSKSMGMLDDCCMLPLLATISLSILTKLCSRSPLLLAWPINLNRFFNALGKSFLILVALPKWSLLKEVQFGWATVPNKINLSLSWNIC